MPPRRRSPNWGLAQNAHSLSGVGEASERPLLPNLHSIHGLSWLVPLLQCPPFKLLPDFFFVFLPSLSKYVNLIGCAQDGK